MLLAAGRTSTNTSCIVPPIPVRVNSRISLVGDVAFVRASRRSSGTIVSVVAQDIAGLVVVPVQSAVRSVRLAP